MDAERFAPRSLAQHSRQWGEIIPFGFSIQTQEFVEPVNQTDFSQEIAILYLLDADDVASTNETIYEGN